MCVVTINIDEAALRDIRPELNSTAAIRHWAQELVDLRIQQMRVEEEGEAIDVETLRADLHRMVEEIYAEA